jgi:hypothetical protein
MWHNHAFGSSRISVTELAFLSRLERKCELERNLFTGNLMEIWIWGATFFSTQPITGDADTSTTDKYSSTPLAHQSSLPSNSLSARVKLSHMARPTHIFGTFQHPAPGNSQHNPFTINRISPVTAAPEIKFFCSDFVT